MKLIWKLYKNKNHVKNSKAKILYSLDYVRLFKHPYFKQQCKALQETFPHYWIVFWFLDTCHCSTISRFKGLRKISFKNLFKTKGLIV